MFSMNARHISVICMYKIIARNLDCLPTWVTVGRQDHPYLLYIRAQKVMVTNPHTAQTLLVGKFKKHNYFIDNLNEWSIF